MIHSIFIALYLVHPAHDGKSLVSSLMTGYTDESACAYAQKEGSDYEVWILTASGDPSKLRLEYKKLECKNVK